MSEVNDFLRTTEQRIFWIRQHLYIPSKGFFELSFGLFGLRGKGIGHWFTKPHVYYCMPFLVIPFVCTFTFAFNKNWEPYIPIYKAPSGEVDHYEKRHWLIKFPRRMYINIHGIMIGVKWGLSRCHI